MKKIRVALVSTSLNEIGGQVNHLKNLYKYLDKSKFEVVMFYCSKIETEIRDYMVAEGVNLEDIVFLSRNKKWMIIPFIFQLRRSLLRKKIDIVHTTDIQSDTFGAITARLSGIKYIFSLHSAKIMPDNISLMKRWLYKLLNNIIKNWFIKTVVVSNGLRQELIDEKFRQRDTIQVIRLGIDVPDFYKNRQFLFTNLKNKRPVIGMLSGFQQAKGIDRFISIIPLLAKRLPEAHFLIIGQGAEEENLKNMVSRLNLDEKVRFGKIPWSEKVFPGLENIDIFVMPSIREGCPNTLLEALALARPVVASKIEGIKDIIEDGKDGLLADTANSELFTEKVLDLCQNSDKAIALGENGRRKILTNFTIEHEMDQYKNLYSAVLEEKEKHRAC